MRDALGTSLCLALRSLPHFLCSATLVLPAHRAAALCKTAILGNRSCVALPPASQQSCRFVAAPAHPAPANLVHPARQPKPRTIPLSGTEKAKRPVSEEIARERELKKLCGITRTIHGARPFGATHSGV